MNLTGIWHFLLSACEVMYTALFKEENSNCTIRRYCTRFCHLVPKCLGFVHPRLCNYSLMLIRVANLYLSSSSLCCTLQLICPYIYPGYHTMWC